MLCQLEKPRTGKLDNSISLLLCTILSTFCHVESTGSRMPMQLIIIFSYFLTSVWEQWGDCCSCCRCPREKIISLCVLNMCKSMDIGYWYIHRPNSNAQSMFAHFSQTISFLFQFARSIFCVFVIVFPRGPADSLTTQLCSGLDDRCKYVCIHALYWRILFWIKCTSTTCVFHILFVC